MNLRKSFKKRFNGNLRFLMAVIVLVSSMNFTGATSFAGSQEKKPNQAPINPAFEKYIQQNDPSRPAQTTEKGKKLGYVPSPVKHSKKLSDAPMQLTTGSLPTTFDLRTLGKVTPVKNQGSSGSCWSFATYGSLESSQLPGTTLDFSENNLKNTHGFDFGPNSGGNASMATAYLARWSGPVSELDDPYVASSTSSPTNFPAQKHVQEVDFLPGDITAIKQALMDHGAVYTAFYYSDAFFNDGNDAYYCNTSNSANHAVTIVGWDDTYGQEKFNTPPAGNGAFIIKNSWGTSWGNGGYFYLSYYDVTSLAENAVFLNAESADNYDNNYDYDPLGATSAIGYGSNTAWGANVFTAKASETVEAVSFNTPAQNSSYSVKIYKNISGVPTSGTLALTQSGTIPEEGYHTVDLSSAVQLAVGEKFSVVLSLTSPGYNYPISMEYPYAGYSSKATANTGESFISSNGTSWSDLAVSYRNTNVCLKAFTNDGGQALPTDLIMTTVNGPASGAPGQSVTVSNTVANLGDVAAGPFTIDFFLSSDRIKDASDIKVASRDVQSLPGGGTSTASTSITLPLTNGTYYILGEADTGNTVPESDESNNCLADPEAVVVATQAADLKISTLTAPTKGVIGRTISVSTTAQNAGTLAAGAFEIRYYLSSDRLFDSGDKQIGTKAIASLAPGASTTLKLNLLIPSTTTSANYYVIGVIDAANKIAESNEDNNIKAASNATVIAKK